MVRAIEKESYERIVQNSDHLSDEDLASLFRMTEKIIRAFGYPQKQDRIAYYQQRPVNWKVLWVT